MANSRLVAGGVQLDIRGKFPINLDFEVANIRTIDKRGSSSSLSVIVKGSPQANKLFNNIFEINAKLSTFNPNKKVPATFYVDEVPLLVGNLQLIEIERAYRGQLIQVSYRCYLLGNSADLFTTLKSKLLTDLDFTDLDHIYDYTGDKFNPAELGKGYVYPYIDYGLSETGNPVTNAWKFTNLKPAIFEKEFIDRMFADAGFTYTSDFLNSNYYKRIINPCVFGGHLKQTIANPALNQFSVNRTNQFNNIQKQGTLTGSSFTFYNYLDIIYPTVPFNNKVSDPGNLYNLTTNTATIRSGAEYVFQSLLNIQMLIECGTNSTQVDRVELNYSVRYLLVNVEVGTGIQNVIASGVINFDESVNGSKFFTFNKTLTITSPILTFNSGDRFFLEIDQEQNNQATAYKNNVPVTNRAIYLQVCIRTGSTFFSKLGAETPDLDLSYGGNVIMNKTIPENITQFEYLKGIILSENLYIEQDPQNPRNYIIEPRDQFVNTLPYLDWTDKVDFLRPTRIYPSGELNIQEYIFKQALDNDYANLETINKFKDRYGTVNVKIDNDFSNAEKIIETIFAPTPNIGNAINNIITPGFYQKNEAGEVSVIDVKPRRLYWYGSLDCDEFRMFWGDPANTEEIRNTYFYAGATDQPFNMTLDLGFGIPQQLFYAFTGTYTSNGRFSERYLELVSALSSPNTKLVKMWINLTANDIANFSFRRVVFIVDAFYYVNKITGFDPQVKKPIEVELLWLDSNTFTPTK